MRVVNLENDNGLTIAFAIERDNGTLSEIVAPDTWETLAECEARALEIAGIAPAHRVPFARPILAYSNDSPRLSPRRGELSLVAI